MCDKTNQITWVLSKDSDQTWQIPSLTRVFTVGFLFKRLIADEKQFIQKNSESACNGLMTSISELLYVEKISNLKWSYDNQILMGMVNLDSEKCPIV